MHHTCNNIEPGIVVSMRFCRRAAGAEPSGAPALWQAAEIIAAGAAGCDVVLLASGARARVPHAAVAASGYAEGMAEGGSPDGSDGSDDDGVLVGSRTEAAASAGEESGSGCSEEDEEEDAYGRTSMALAASAAAIMQARAPRGSIEWQRPAVEPCSTLRDEQVVFRLSAASRCSRLVTPSPALPCVFWDGDCGACGGQAAEAGPQSDTAHFADFEAHTRGIGSRLLARWGFVSGRGVGPRGNGMSAPLEARRHTLRKIAFAICCCLQGRDAFVCILDVRCPVLLLEFMYGSMQHYWQVVLILAASEDTKKKGACPMACLCAKVLCHHWNTVLRVTVPAPTHSQLDVQRRNQ